jgi:diguanylate cyclase (GGDEF)-like protein
VQEDPLNNMTAITADNLGRAAIRLPVAVLWPAIILAAAWGITEYADKIPEVIRGLLEYLPYAVTLVGVFIGWRFDRSRLVFSLIAVSIGHWMMTGPASSIEPGSSGEIGYMAYALCRGLLRAAAFAGLCIAVLALTAADHWLAKGIASSIQQGAVQILSAPVIPDFLTPTSSIPEPALIVFVATTAFFIMRLVALGNPPLESGALGGLVAGGMALHFAGNIQAVSLFFTAAAISILIAVIQDSYRLAFVDDLTGLPGRNALSMETLKLGQRYAIAMLDVDHFKKFNDTYGHDIGDQVLRMVAGQMARVGGGGKPFRYGGEEFTIIFPGKTAEEAITNLDALRQVIKESGFTIRAKDRLKAKASTKRNGKGKRVSVTISIGVSERSEKNPAPEDVTKAADQALYRAKKGGRNRVSK